MSENQTHTICKCNHKNQTHTICKVNFEGEFVNSILNELDLQNLELKLSFKVK